MYLKNAHVSDVPLLSDLFRFSGITEFDRLATTDVEATFASKGPTITLRVVQSTVLGDPVPGARTRRSRTGTLSRRTQYTPDAKGESTASRTFRIGRQELPEV